MLRLALCFALLSAGAEAAPLRPGTPSFSLRLEALAGQPTGLLGARAGAGIGLGYRLSDQLSLTADASQRAAPGGGIGSLAVGLQATLDSTPISPYLEVAVVQLTPKATLGYSLATRTGVGADWHFSAAWAIGLALRTLLAIDPATDQLGQSVTTGGSELALRLVFIPGAR